MIINSLTVHIGYDIRTTINDDLCDRKYAFKRREILYRPWQRIHEIFIYLFI